MLDTDETISRELNHLDIAGLIQIQRTNGRRYLASQNADAQAFRQQWSSAYSRAVSLLADEGRGRRVRQLATLLKEVTFSIHAMNTEPYVTYYPYTDVHVLDWYLRPTHVPFAVLKRRALYGALYLLRDLSRFEADSLSGIETRHREKLSREVVVRRIDKIRDAIEACKSVFQLAEIAVPSPMDEPVIYRHLEDYVGEATRLSVLVHFTCFPRTECHDEVVFLRTIHLGELCFFALRMLIMEAIENLRRRRMAEGAQCLLEGVSVADLLHRIFAILNTMPKEHFLDFREYTERGSAIQSRGYQLLDIYFRGVDGRKLQAFSECPGLADLYWFGDASFVSLRSIIRDTQLQRHDEWPVVESVARQLDKTFMTWRGLHIALALKYLDAAEAATGGTSGAPYLKQFMAEGLFSDTSVDLELVSRIWDDQEILALVPVADGVAPRSERRGATRNPKRIPPRE